MTPRARRECGQHDLAEIKIANLGSGRDARRKPPNIAETLWRLDRDRGKVCERHPHIPSAGDDLETRPDARVRIFDRLKRPAVECSTDRMRGIRHGKLAGVEHLLTQ